MSRRQHTPGIPFVNVGSRCLKFAWNWLELWFASCCYSHKLWPHTFTQSSAQCMLSVCPLAVECLCVCVLTNRLLGGGAGWGEGFCEIDVAHVAAAATEMVRPILDLWRQVGHHAAVVTAALVVAQVSPAPWERDGREGEKGRGEDKAGEGLNGLLEQLLRLLT